MKISFNIRIVLSILLTMIISISGFGQNEKDIVLGKEYSMYSEMLKKDMPYWLHLPKSYKDTIYCPQKYPLLVILDAEEHFELATSIFKFMSTRLDSKEIPEFIIVGLSGMNRIHDYTPTHSIHNPVGVEVEAFAKSGGGPKFLDFIGQELIVHLDKKYRTLPYRILVGHSLGGTLAVYDYFSEDAIFNSFIAIDPSLWWDNELLVERAKLDDLNSIKKTNRRLYISAAHNSALTIDTTPMKKSQEAFYAALEAKIGKDSVKINFQYFENEDHGTVVLPTLYHGMRYVFKDYRMKNMLEASAREISNYFEKSSKRLGMQLLPSERVIDILGNYFLNSDKEVNKARSFFELNVSNYPNSYHAHFSLAEAYKTQGDKNSAIKYYKKSLELKPSNKIARKALQEVSSK